MYKCFFKRFLDIVISFFGVLGFLVVFIFVAPIIHFTDGGPVFYNAERRGKDGKVFKMYKFRSMKVNSPDLRNADGSTYNGANDPRVTKIGKILRKTSLDEVPQVLNIFLGDMSIVGPRPVLPTKPLDPSDADRMKRFSVRPGLTGYSQAYFRNSIDQDEKLKNDCYYVDHLTFMMDVKVIFVTAMSVLKRKNIYVEQGETHLAEKKEEVNK